MRWLGRKKKTNLPALPMLSTARLVLRALDPSDAVDVYAYARNPKVASMAGFAAHTSLDESRAMVQKLIQAGDCWAVVEKNGGRMIGFISLCVDWKRPKVKNAMRIGYVLSEAFWGQGYATEACREALRYAFEERDCPVVSSEHFPSNQKSRRVIKKLGFVQEGVIRHAGMLPDGTPSDMVSYSLLKSEYEVLVQKNK